MFASNTSRANILSFVRAEEGAGAAFVDEFLAAEAVVTSPGERVHVMKCPSQSLERWQRRCELIDINGPIDPMKVIDVRIRQRVRNDVSAVNTIIGEQLESG